MSRRSIEPPAELLKYRPSQAALFAGVVTTFIIESYTALKPDIAQETLDALRTISQQLNGTTNVAASEAAPFKPRTLDVARTTILFISLLLTLIASIKSIDIKNTLPTTSTELSYEEHPECPRKRTYARQLHYNTDSPYYDSFSPLAFLAYAIYLFMIAIIMFTWDLGNHLRGAVLGTIVAWFAFDVICTVADHNPVAANRCAYALGHGPDPAVSGASWTMETKALSQALAYALPTRWYTEDVPSLWLCLEDLQPEAARWVVVDALRSLFDSAQLAQLLSRDVNPYYNRIFAHLPDTHANERSVRQQESHDADSEKGLDQESKTRKTLRARLRSFESDWIVRTSGLGRRGPPDTAELLVVLDAFMMAIDKHQELQPSPGTLSPPTQPADSA
ncbi:hypothetical protein OH77DRAFT_805433 [Trametes cingulata]|nr:hypothetical protein OH77DRAFT_805433 [Trametes cingulata]